MVVVYSRIGYVMGKMTVVTVRMKFGTESLATHQRSADLTRFFATPPRDVYPASMLVMGITTVVIGPTSCLAIVVQGEVLPVLQENFSVQTVVVYLSNGNVTRITTVGMVRMKIRKSVPTALVPTLSSDVEMDVVFRFTGFVTGTMM